MLAHFLRKAVDDGLQPRAGRTAVPMVPVGDDHLAAAKAWLVRSIEACDGVASSKGYRFMKGWMPAYPETSGYIIPTLLSLAREDGEAGLGETAHRIGAWLTSIQREDGGFAGYELGARTEPDVFDTGMILLGLNALIHGGDADTFTAAADAAAGFLARSMDEDGCFVRHMSHDMIHAYNVRSAWGLMAFGKLAGNEAYVSRAADCAKWTISRQNEQGFYLDNAFKPGGNANSHGTAYVMRGLLQIHLLSGDPACLASVRRAADAVCRHYEDNGRVAAELGPHWQPLASHICLTGYAQLAIVLYRLGAITGEATYRAMADRLLADVAARQTLGEDGPWHGGIPGSFPIWGRYAPLQYPNWATKFFIDALLVQKSVAAGQASWRDVDLYAG
ncbi:MAG: hypothetical protein R3D44_02250 [Hyphomicrobiaceae bacterium]